MAIRMEVWGDYALFTRPEMKVERVSYDVMTPSAARGLLEAVYWHPGLRWVIDCIHVCAPIRFTNLRRNEVKSTLSARSVRTVMERGIRRNEVDEVVSASNVRTVMSGRTKPLYIDRSSHVQQRAAMVLKDVRYVIEAHFTLTDKANETDNPGKFQDIVKRRLESGKCYHTPYFGCREFPANFRCFTGGEPETAYPGETKDLGYMLYDMDYSDPKNIEPTFFRAKLINGVLDLRDCEVIR